LPQRTQREDGKMKNKNYKLQNTNYKQITNYNVQNYKQRGKEESKIMKSFCRGSRGVVFSKRAPLAAGGKKGVNYAVRNT
jgi:hypothetical protein